MRSDRDVRTAMLIFLKFIATFSAALFAGAALYINVAEPPWRENRAQSCRDNPVSVSRAWILVVGS